MHIMLHIYNQTIDLPWHIINEGLKIFPTPDKTEQIQLPNMQFA